MKRKPNWNNEELEILKNFYGNEERNIIENLLPNRNWEGIQLKASELKIKRLNYFTIEDLQFIKNNYMSMSSRKIAKTLGRHRGNIEQKAREMGFVKQEKWTNEDIDLLKDNFGKFTVDEISKNVLFNRTSSSIYHMIQTLDLQEKTERYINVSNDELIEKMKNICETLGRTIMNRELTYFGLPSPKLFVDRFGSYSNFCKICDLIPNTGFVKAMKLIDKNGQKCLSNAEKIISDFLFDNNFNYKKEFPYNKIIDSCITRMRCDWFLNSKIVVEYFGMERHKKYKEKMNRKIKLCQDNNIILIPIYDRDIISDIYKQKLLPFIK